MKNYSVILEIIEIKHEIRIPSLNNIIVES